MPWQALADLILLIHFGVVLFVVGGLVLILLGGQRGWSWTRGWWFRSAHLAAILFVVAESWFGIECPLTTLEWWLRAQAGDALEARGFIEYWVGRLLFWNAPPRVFAAAYTLFALLVAGAWLRYPPRRRPRH